MRRADWLAVGISACTIAAWFITASFTHAATIYSQPDSGFQWSVNAGPPDYWSSYGLGDSYFDVGSIGTTTFTASHSFSAYIWIEDKNSDSYVEAVLYSWTATSSTAVCAGVITLGNIDDYTAGYTPITVHCNSVAGTYTPAPGRYLALSITTNANQARSWTLGNVLAQAYVRICDNASCAIPTVAPPPVVGTCGISDILACIQQALMWAFYPTQDRLQQLVDDRDLIATKKPFGDITATIDAIETLNATATPAFVIPSVYTINSAIFAPLVNGLGAIFFIVFGLWFWRRVRHLDI